MRDITRVKQILAEIISQSDDEKVDELATEALKLLSSDDARETRKKPSLRG